MDVLVRLEHGRTDSPVLAHVNSLPVLPFGTRSRREVVTLYGAADANALALALAACDSGGGGGGVVSTPGPTPTPSPTPPPPTAAQANALALGASEATLIDMTGAYAGILNGGSAVKPYGLRELQLQGEPEPLLGQDGGMGERVITQEAAKLLTYMMTQVIQKGTGGRARLAADGAFRPVGAGLPDPDAVPDPHAAGQAAVRAGHDRVRDHAGRFDRAVRGHRLQGDDGEGRDRLIPQAVAQ